MRKLIVLAVVVALALLVVPAAFAGNGNAGSMGSIGGRPMDVTRCLPVAAAIHTRRAARITR